MMYQENNQYLFGVNSFYICVSVLSLVLFGPLITFATICAIGFLNSYNRISIGSLLIAVIYCMFGYTGLLMVKIACIYTMFNIYYSTFTSNKIVKFARNNNFSHINSNTIETFGSSVANKYNKFRTCVIDSAYKIKNYVSAKNYKISKFIDTFVGAYPELLNKVNIVYLEIIDNVCLIHNTVYESKYDIYVYTSDYIYDGYIVLKFMSMMFSTSMQSDTSLDKFTSQPIPECTETFINQLNDTFSAMMANFGDVECDTSQTLGKMNSNMFMKLLKI